MDEPLGALDQQAARAHADRAKQLHDALGVTILYVTHDQNEALTMSDRIAVFHRRRDRSSSARRTSSTTQPADAFVASFIGENNLFDGVVEQVGDAACRVRLQGGLPIAARPMRLDGAGCAVRVAVRPECVRLAVGGTGGEQFHRPGGGSGLSRGPSTTSGAAANGQQVTVKADAALVTAAGDWSC